MTLEPMPNGTCRCRTEIAQLDRLRAALASAWLLVTETDAQGFITYICPNSHHYLGYTPEECVGRHVLDFIHADDRDALQQQIEEWVQLGLRSVQIENHVVHRDGHAFDFLWAITLHYDEDNHLVGFTSIGHDISPIEQLRDELYHSRDMLHLVIDSLPLGVFWKDTASRFLGCNRRALADAGLTNVAEMVGKTDFDLPWRDKAALYQQSDRLVMATGPKLNIEETFTRGDGSVIWLRTGKLPLKRNGDVIGVLGFYEDITEVRQQEEWLRTFRLLVESAPDGIGIADPELRLIYANPAFAAMLGYETLAGKMWLDLVHPADRVQLDQIVHAAAEGGVAQTTIRYLHRNGSPITVQLSIPVLRNRDGQLAGYASINRDITEQLRAEEERQRLALQEQVIQAQQAILRELSTPLLPIADGVVVMPLIGAVDTARAQQILEALLDGVSRHRAKVAIIDITGVKVVDTQVASALIRAAQAAGLLGAQVVLTGISPEIAQTLVQIGVTMQGLVTRATLQEGVAYAFRSQPVSQPANGRVAAGKRFA